MPLSAVPLDGGATPFHGAIWGLNSPLADGCSAACRPQGKAFAEEFVLRKRMDTVEVVSNRKKQEAASGRDSSASDSGIMGDVAVKKKKK